LERELQWMAARGRGEATEGVGNKIDYFSL
jgi:hypothetical protein